MRYIILTFIFVFIHLNAFSEAKVLPIETYGELPKVRSVEISPDGSKIAYLFNNDGTEALVVKDLDTGKAKGVDTSSLKTFGLEFIGNDFVSMKVAETSHTNISYRNKYEYTAAFSYDLRREKISRLLTQKAPANTNSLIKIKNKIHPAQSGLGRIVGNFSKKNQVFMPAYIGEETSQNPKYSLVTVDPKNGRPKVFENGNTHTVDWFVNRDGKVLAREDINEDRGMYRISTKRNGYWEDVYKKENSTTLPFGLVGIKSDESSLIITKYLNQTESEYGGTALHNLNWDGSISEPLLMKDGTEIDHIISDKNRKVFGVQYSGMRPSYGFFDSKLDKTMKDLVDAYPGYAIQLSSWTDDWQKLVIQVSGGTEAGTFYLYDVLSKQMTKLAASFDIPKEAVGEVITIEYNAKDGTKIPSLLTWPANDGPRSNLPTIILPHGGPESYDQMSFDWLAQYFANRGYLVLQPNFRGSKGFGWDFRKEGRGEWGGLMQEDVSDGVKALIDGGFANPEKICIVGASYGGYSALAGGAFTPELYKCVVAVAPVSDLPKMLSEERWDHGETGWVLKYWERVIGDRKAENSKLENISPVNYAETFKAPVLLVHGNDDTVVNIDQSSVMNNALKKAGKEVEFVKVKGGDHWLSTSETRLETLQAIDSFIAKHNPAN